MAVLTTFSNIWGQFLYTGPSPNFPTNALGPAGRVPLQLPISWGSLPSWSVTDDLWCSHSEMQAKTVTCSYNAYPQPKESPWSLHTMRALGTAAKSRQVYGIQEASSDSKGKGAEPRTCIPMPGPPLPLWLQSVPQATTLSLHGLSHIGPRQSSKARLNAHFV